MSLYGVEINAQMNRLLLEVRLQLARKLIPNVRTIYRSFAHLDSQASGAVSLQLFEKALNQNGIFFKKFQFQVFQKTYRNEQGKLNWLAFLSHLKEPMGPMRRYTIEAIHDHIASLNNGKVTVASLRNSFNPAAFQQIQMGKLSKDKVQMDLLSLLVVSDGEIKKDDFVSFYDDLNVNYPSTDGFIRIISESWCFTPEKFQPVTEEELRGVVKGLRWKLIQKSKGASDEFLMMKLFQEYDENKNGHISHFELDLMLKKLQMPVHPRIIGPLLQKLDKNKSGFIEYDEYKQFLFFDPFP